MVCCSNTGRFATASPRATGGHRTRLLSVSLCPLLVSLPILYMIRFASHLPHYPVSAESHSSGKSAVETDSESNVLILSG